MTKSEFVDFLKIDYTQYLRYEKGEINPEVPLAVYISEKLNRSVNDIWSWYLVE